MRLRVKIAYGILGTFALVAVGMLVAAVIIQPIVLVLFGVPTLLVGAIGVIAHDSARNR